MYSWDDLRFFLEVERHGSLTKAGAELRVDPTTVGRRLEALEAQLGQPLFIRARPQWRLTPAGRRVLPAALQMETSSFEIGRLSAEDELAPTGRVRLSTFDVIGTRVIAPALPELHRRYPGLRLDVLCTPKILDLLRGEADLALRQGRPKEESLLARKVASASESLYASRTFLEVRGLGAKLDDLTGLPALVHYTDEAWTEVTGAKLALRTSSTNVLVAAVVAGVGIGFVPDVVARAELALVRLQTSVPPRERPLWLSVQRDLAKVPRVRVVADFLAQLMETQTERKAVLERELETLPKGP